MAELINDLLRGMAPDQAGGDDALMKLFGEFKDQVHVLLRCNDRACLCPSPGEHRDPLNRAS